MHIQCTSGASERKVALQNLSQEIISCRKCIRLVSFREKIAREKKKQFFNFDYWGKPVPGFGDENAGLIVIGLAPAAHGGNRTGRVFTGDASARFLMRHLYEAGFANQPTSENRLDGLELNNCYMTAALRCVPPDNIPNPKEMGNCSSYFTRELVLLDRAKAILALGKIAFDSVVRYAKQNYSVKGRFIFAHGKQFSFSRNFPLVFCSYHPSPRNTNTGKMTDAIFSSVLLAINHFLSN